MQSSTQFCLTLHFPKNISYIIISNFRSELANTILQQPPWVKDEEEISNEEDSSSGSSNEEEGAPGDRDNQS